MKIFIGHFYVPFITLVVVFIHISIAIFFVINRSRKLDDKTEVKEEIKCQKKIINGNISAINNANIKIISNKIINSNKHQNKNGNESEKKAAKKSAIKIQSVIRRFLVSTRFKRTYGNDSDNNNDVPTEEKRDKRDRRQNCSENTQHTASLYYENKKVNKETSSRNCGSKNRSEKVGTEGMLVKKDETMSKKESRKGEVKENEKEKEKWEIAQTLSTSMKIDKHSNTSIKVDKRSNEKAAVKTMEPVDGKKNQICCCLILNFVHCCLLSGYVCTSFCPPLPCLSLSLLVSPCLSLSLLVSPCLFLSLLVSPCLSLSLLSFPLFYCPSSVTSTFLTFTMIGASSTSLISADNFSITMTIPAHQSSLLSTYISIFQYPLPIPIQGVVVVQEV
jgi:hypothetical protein